MPEEEDADEEANTTMIMVSRLMDERPGSEGASARTEHGLRKQGS
jgi:hypothetical protein